jgi:tRNA threonylcarbamoyladenosine biosynthesis protein TsaE
MRPHPSRSRSRIWNASSERLTAPDGVARYPPAVTRPADVVVVPSNEPAATRALAARLARVAQPGDLLCLIGELGAGKTQFAKGFGAGLGVIDVVNSPTFVLMTEYDGRLPLFHLDLYRLADAQDALAGGLLDERQREGVTLVEWAERLGDAVPDGRLEVHIEGTGDEPRSIRLQAGDTRHRRYLTAAAATETAA